jgi:hypothetical protein
VQTKWNTANSYVEAVRNKTKILRKLFAAAPDRTVLIIVSDHGHVDRGGHGGTDQVLRDVPLIIYSKGSKLESMAASSPSTHPKFAREAGLNGPLYDNTDIAPTICALLGLPVPRTGQGRLIEEALHLLPKDRLQLHLNDLLYQLTAVFSQWKVAVEADMNVPPLPSKVTDTGATSDITAAIDKLRREYFASRQRILASSVQNNQLLNVLVADFIMVIIMLHALQRYTMADPWNAFRVMFKWVPCFGFHLSEHQLLVGKMNLRAMTLSVALAFLYFIFTIGTLLAITFGIGYAAWDSTLIHSPNAFVRYLGISLGPAFLYSLIHLRIIEIVTIDPTSIFVKVSLPLPLRTLCSTRRTSPPSFSPSILLRSEPALAPLNVPAHQSAHRHFPPLLL